MFVIRRWRAWVLAAAALVMFMTPGLAFFYGGFVRNKNVLGTIMQSFVVMGIVGVLWILIGYTLAFGPTEGGIIGNLDYIGLKGVVMEPHPSFAIPHEAFVVFQLMFAIITPALITGAFAERAKFSTFLIFMAAWSILVYAPVAHWIFGDGFLSAFSAIDVLGVFGDINALDFAGGTAIHVNAGAAALAAAIMFGRRKGYGVEAMEPHNVRYIVLGAAILWFGWFGFNAGSALAANGSAVNAFMVTNTAAAMAALTWVMLGYFTTGRASAVGAASGAVAGLVAITPAAGDVGAMGSLGIGLIAGALTWLTVRYRHLLRIDDALEGFAVHGVGGIVGALLTGVCAAAVLQGNAGVVDGEFDLLWANFRAVAATVGYSFGVTIVILMILDKVPGLGLRASESDEDNGVDISFHGERGYVGDGAD